MLHLSYSSEAVMALTTNYYGNCPSPLTLLTGSAAALKHNDFANFLTTLTSGDYKRGPGWATPPQIFPWPPACPSQIFS